MNNESLKKYIKKEKTDSAVLQFHIVFLPAEDV